MDKVPIPTDVRILIVEDNDLLKEMLSMSFTKVQLKGSVQRYLERRKKAIGR